MKQFQLHTQRNIHRNSNLETLSHDHLIFRHCKLLNGRIDVELGERFVGIDTALKVLERTLNNPVSTSAVIEDYSSIRVELVGNRAPIKLFLNLLNA